MIDLFSSVGKAFEEGGYMMWVILIAEVVSLAIIIERTAILFFRTRVNKEAFVRGVRAEILKGNLDHVVRYVSRHGDNPLTRIVKAGLLRAPMGDDHVQAAMDEAALRELPKLERRTGYLAMIGNVSTLLGLLGTIVGLIHCFRAVSFADPAEKAVLLARGISEAMNCTGFGLGVAIPALIFFSILNGRTQRVVDDINEASTSVVNFISAHREKMDMNIEGGRAAAA
jgi:biopolymer transport protein ExbB/TolQ